MEAILASVVLPAAVDLFKNLFSGLGRKFVGLSVDDQIKLQSAEISKLQAIAQLDNPHGTPSQWVIDLRASFRYIAAGVVILVGAGIAVLGWHSKDAATMASGLEIAGMPFGFIFGERMYLGFKGGLSK
jgi:hypothetical protein